MTTAAITKTCDEIQLFVIEQIDRSRTILAFTNVVFGQISKKQIGNVAKTGKFKEMKRRYQLHLM